MITKFPVRQHGCEPGESQDTFWITAHVLGIIDWAVLEVNKLPPEERTRGAEAMLAGEQVGAYCIKCGMSARDVARWPEALCLVEGRETTMGNLVALGKNFEQLMVWEK